MNIILPIILITFLLFAVRHMPYAKVLPAFTLIELLVVISIIGVLATIVTTNLNSARERARDLKRKQELREMQSALQLYYNTYGSFPADNIPHCGAGSDNCEQGDIFTISGITYMKSLPEFTFDNTDDSSYNLTVTLENPSDPDLTTSQSVCPGTYDDTDYVVCP